MRQEFENKCKDGKFYQLKVAEYENIITSIPACQYSKSGFNDTLVFHADSAGNLNSMTFDVIDY